MTTVLPIARSTLNSAQRRLLLLGIGLIVALLAVFVAGCGSFAGLRDLPDPAGPPVVTARGETDGVTLRLDLDRQSLRPGEVVWASLTIENTNDHSINWVGAACAEPGRVVVTTAATGSYGRNWPEYALAELKKRLVASAPPSHVPLLDQHQWQLRSQGLPACTQEIRSFDLAARSTLRSHFAWDGMLSGAPAPSGPVEVQAGFSMNDKQRMVGRSVSAVAIVELTGGSSVRFSPGRAVDAALEDGRLAQWITARTTPDSSGTAAAYGLDGTVRLDGAIWVITVVRRAGPARGSGIEQIAVRVDSQTGAVISVAS